MRTFEYWEPDDEGGAVQTIKTEKEIEEYYFPWWSERMRKLDREDKINLETCIEDWCITNWATEIKDHNDCYQPPQPTRRGS